MKPIELEARPTHVLHGFGEEIIFTQVEADTYEIDRRSNGKTFVKKQINWSPLSELDITDDIRSSYLDSDDNITMRRITAVRFNGQKCYYLRNRSMKVMTFRNISELQFKRRESMGEVIQEVYDIDVYSLSESLDFLEERGIEIIFRKELKKHLPEIGR